MVTSQPLPRSLQISETLIREIASGLRPNGSRLPPERQMALDYGVAVGTLRKALSHLEEKGLLERVQGSGNYIRRHSYADSIYAPFRLEKPGGGGLPTATILSTEETASPKAARLFGFPEQAFQIVRTRYLDDSPVAIEHIWLSGDYALRGSEQEMSDSLYLYYRDVLGLIISRVEDRVGVDRLPEGYALHGTRPDEVLGFIERRAWSQTDEAAEYSRTWFNPQAARFINRISIETNA